MTERPELLEEQWISGVNRLQSVAPAINTASAFT